MSSKESTSKENPTINAVRMTLFLIKQQLDNLKNRFDLLSKELQQVFGIDYSGHANTYELQINEILHRLDQFDDKAYKLQELEMAVNNIEQDNNDLDDRIRSLERDLDVI